MVKEPKKNVVYWLAGHSVYANWHIVPVTARYVYHDDLSINGDIDVTAVPHSFRQSISPESNTINTVIHPEALFETREEAAFELTILLFHKQSELAVASLALEREYAIIKAARKAVEDKSNTHQHPSKLVTST